MAFVLPVIFDSDIGWGPGNEVPVAFNDVPYAPFNKSDSVGKVFDWDSIGAFQLSMHENGNSQIFIM